MSRLAAPAVVPLPLDRRRSWVLLTGAGDAPAVHHAVAGLLILSATATLIWLTSWFQDAWLGRAGAGEVALATVAAFIVLVPIWRLWQRWHAPANALTLHWEGLPRPVGRPAHQPSKGEWVAERSGWWVSPWRCASDLAVVLDLQRHVLIKLTPRVALPNAQPVWLWLDLRAVERRHQEDRRQAGAHMLRTCLYVRVPAEDASAEPGSSLERKGIDSALSAPVASSPAGTPQSLYPGPDLAHHDNPTLAALMAEHVHADFADTEVCLPESSVPESARAQSLRELA